MIYPDSCSGSVYLGLCRHVCHTWSIWDVIIPAFLALKPPPSAGMTSKHWDDQADWSAIAQATATWQKRIPVSPPWGPQDAASLRGLTVLGSAVDGEAVRMNSMDIMCVSWLFAGDIRSYITHGRTSRHQVHCLQCNQQVKEIKIFVWTRGIHFDGHHYFHHEYIRTI